MVEKKLPIVRTHGSTALVLLVQAIGYFVINGFSLSWSLLALAGTIIGTLALWFENPIKLKAAMLVMGFIWLGYQIVAGAYGQIPGELVFIVGLIISTIMLTKAQKNGIPLTEVEELPVLLRRKLTERKVPTEEENSTELVFT